MSSYRCVALSTEDVGRYRTLGVDDFGNLIQRLNVPETYPCRHCLREARADGGVLLLSYRAPEPRSVYGHPTPIFLCAQPCARFDERDRVPEIVRNRHVSLRAFDSDGMMLYSCSELVDSAGHDTAIRRILDRAQVAFINVHTAKAGCMLCQIVRATS